MQRYQMRVAGCARSDVLKFAYRRKEATALQRAIYIYSLLLVQFVLRAMTNQHASGMSR